MRKHLRSLAALTLLTAVALSQRADAAQVGGLRLERADVSAYPLIKLYLSYVEADGRAVTGKTKDDFKLIFDSNEQGVAADAKPIDQTGEPIYLAVVVQVSNAMSDALDEEKRGVRALAAAAADMKGSKVSLISYASETKRLAELTKPEEIDGAAGGLVLDTEGTEVHLLDSVRTAIDLLNSKGVPDNARKLVAVFADGLDISGSEKRAFAELGKKALLANIVIDTIGYAPFDPSKLKNLAELSKQSNGTHRECKTAQEVGAQFANVADEIKKQYVVLFQSVIAGDAKEHIIQVVTDTGGKPIYSNNVSKICENHEVVIEGKPFWKKWWFWVICGLLPFALLIVLYLIFGKRNKMEGVEFQGGGAAAASSSMGSGSRSAIRIPAIGTGGAMSAAMGAAAAAGGGPQRTMALDLGAVTGKGPTIGWIVGINGGRYNERTFRLSSAGRTVIGKAPDCDIVLEDDLVSGKHCEVRYDGNTYKIVDLGSTNGIVVNDKRVLTSELVDGDSLKLGRVEWKFKAVH